MKRFASLGATPFNPPCSSRLIAILFLGALPMLLANGATARIFDFNEVNDPTDDGTDVWKGQSVAQSFNASGDYYLEGVSLYLLDSREASSLTVAIVSNSGGLPNETAVLASRTSMAPSINTWYWLDFGFSTPPLLLRGPKYWIVATSDMTFAKGYKWDRSYRDAYAGGSAAIKQPAGGWVLIDDDQMFRTYGKPKDPSITVEKSVNATVAGPGDLLRYIIYYNNTGGGLAKSVWINDTLPQGLNFLSSNPSPESWSGSTYRWKFQNLGPGNYSIVVNTSIRLDVLDGTQLTNGVSLEYSNQSGAKLAPSQDTIMTLIRAPKLTLAKSADKAEAYPGQEITYTIRYDNLGSAPASFITIRDVTPPGMIFINSTEEGARIGGTNWTLYDVAPGGHLFEITAKVSEGTASNITLVNWAWLESFDSRGNRLQNLSESAATLILSSVPLPQISANVNLSRYSAKVGDEITLTISYDNDGPGIAGDVWINATFPGEFTVLWTSVPFDSSSNRTYGWHFVNVAVGPHSIEVRIRVTQGTRGTGLETLVTVTYTDSRGYKLSPSSSRITLFIEDDSLSTSGLLLLALLAIAALLSIVLFTGKGAIARLIKTRASIDELFLLHRSGLLIKHYSKSLRPDVDSDVLSGMLVAVQEFVKDSFRFGEGALEELRFGKHRIFMVQGKHSILAAAVSGPKGSKIAGQLTGGVGDIEDRFGEKLAHWSGSVDELKGIDEIMKKLLEGGYKNQKRESDRKE